jgi:hypothetical protein
LRELLTQRRLQQQVWSIVMPKFADPVAWKQAELLMQPAFIRVIDNIRKQLEQSTWKGSYRDVQVWPEGTAEETKVMVAQLQQQLETVSPEQAATIKQELAKLPHAYPGYELCLEHQDEHVNIDLWELCYRVCFRNYDLTASSNESLVEIDTSLIDETGDVDWQCLDQKAKRLVEAVFSNLPGASIPESSTHEIQVEEQLDN